MSIVIRMDHDITEVMDQLDPLVSIETLDIIDTRLRQSVFRKFGGNLSGLLGVDTTKRRIKMQHQGGFTRDFWILEGGFFYEIGK